MVEPAGVEEIVIVGAGLAGVMLATSLVREGMDPEGLVVLGRQDERAGSLSPATMLHAFPGRTMELKRGQGEYFLRSFAYLRELAGSGRDWWVERPMVRPMGSDEKGELLRESYLANRGEFPEALEVALMGPEEAMARFEGLKLEDDVLVYGPAAGVECAAMVADLTERLQGEGVRFERGDVKGLSRVGEAVSVDGADGQLMVAKKVVLAVGAWLKPWFPGLDLRIRAGELLLLEPPERSLKVMVNREKHLFERSDGLWGLGSTYFEEDEWAGRDPETVEEELRAGLRDVIPGIDAARTVGVWRGYRGMFGSDYLPLVGAVPGLEGLYLFAGLGSKGLLYSPALSQDLARSLMEGSQEPIAEEIRPSRIKARRFVAPLCRLG